MKEVPLTLQTYRLATTLLAPAVPFLLKRRARRGKEDLRRLPERLGHAERARPEGTLIWIHGASVGECLAALPLIEALLAVPNRHVLLTSGTVASAQLMAERLPQRAFHQFSPVDTPAAVEGFLRHWHPDVGLFVDSEIWPNMLMTAHDKGVRLAMINGRMSAKSFAGWQKARHVAARLLDLYDLCLVQDRETAQRLKTLGGRNIAVAGSLKADAPPLPADPAALTALREAIGARPVFLATNTHAGEDEIILTVHDALRREYPDLVTIIAPRHAERGDGIATLCGHRAHAQRSKGEPLDRGVEIYVADTMGELGLFYRLARFAVIGKSLTGHGGQNPLEPARLKVAVLAGSYTENFRETYEAIFAAQGEGRVGSDTELAALAGRLLRDNTKAETMGLAAEKAAVALGGALEKTRVAVEELLGHARA